ncbi:DUF6346 domain-containing protein [Prauserella flavalba]|uniref:DUF6346 domain-containing protein n=1 Tax=Prauserella flavalba TaxID=1477506 RepID=UPI0036F1382D
MIADETPLEDPRLLAGLRNRRERLAMFGESVATWLVLVVAVLGLLTAFRIADAPENNTRTGSGAALAQVESCERRGPVSTGGLGYFWECTARVPGVDGPVAFRADELTAADIGRTVPVRQDDGKWVRDVGHPYGFLTVLVWVAVAGGVVFVWATGFRSLFAALAFSATLRYRADPDLRRVTANRYHRDGRLPSVPSAPTAPSSEEPSRPSDPARVEIPLHGANDLAVRIVLVAYLAVNALAVLGLGGVLGYVTHDLGTGFDPAYLLSGALVVLGLALGWVTVYGHREAAKPSVSYVTVTLDEQGIHVPMNDDTTRTVPWRQVEGLVFDEYPGPHGAELVTAYCSRESAEGTPPWPPEFVRTTGRYGHVLSPALPLADAETFAAAAERYRPGVVRWPAREVRRGGFGFARTLRAAARIVRWGAAKAEPGAAVTVDAATPSVARTSGVFTTWLLGLATLAALAGGLEEPALALGVLTCAGIVVLYRARFRGGPGEFVVDGERLRFAQPGGHVLSVDWGDVRELVVEDGLVRLVPSDEPIEGLHAGVLAELSREAGRRLAAAVRERGPERVAVRA